MLSQFEFQDMYTQKVIGSANEVGGLYYFESEPTDIAMRKFPPDEVWKYINNKFSEEPYPVD